MMLKLHFEGNEGSYHYPNKKTKLHSIIARYFFQSMLLNVGKVNNL